MNRSLLGLLAASSAAAAIAACSAAPDSGGLGTISHYGNPATSSSSGGSSSGSSGSGSSSGSTASSSGGSSSGGTASSSSGTQAPPPAGPGSTQSQAHQFFDATVYPEILATCAGCHANATDGAPKMMDSPADTTYSELDARGLIVGNSLLLTQGVHDSSKAPALTTQEQSDVTTWLNMEVAERSAAGAAPTNVLADLANCVDETEWNSIGWKNLKTQPRQGTNAENPQRCTGCNNDVCRSCHEGGEADFFMAEGSNLQPAGTTFQETFYGSSASIYMTRYFGLNGTTPVASNAIMTKMQAVAVGPAYSHPMFVMSQTMQDALNTFVNDAITKYTAEGGKCTPSSDAGLGGD